MLPNAPGTQGFNPYAYAANNPTSWTDPSGHAVRGFASGGGGGARPDPSVTLRDFGCGALGGLVGVFMCLVAAFLWVAWVVECYRYGYGECASPFLAAGEFTKAWKSGRELRGAIWGWPSKPHVSFSAGPSSLEDATGGGGGGAGAPPVVPMPDFSAVGRGIKWVIFTVATVLVVEREVNVDIEVYCVPPAVEPTPEPTPQRSPTEQPIGPPVPVERATGTEEAREKNWVVRAGVATADQLQRGSAEHGGVPGLFGFSVQYQPGLTIQQLATAGQFPHAQMSVATDVELFAAAAAGGDPGVRLVPSPGRGYHHTVAVPSPMPSNLAQALSAVFRQRPNPAVRGG